MEIELEKTYLLKYLPADLEKFSSHEILDIYFPEEEPHPFLRIRSIDNQKFQITKKQPIDGKDSSEQTEHTINLSKEEFDALAKFGRKKSKKKRYYYKINSGHIAEITVFLDDLEGLCLVDFEFGTKEEKDNFVGPEFCLYDATQDIEIAGGVLAGKKYSDLEEYLNKHGYRKIQ